MEERIARPFSKPEMIFANFAAISHFLQDVFQFYFFKKKYVTFPHGDYKNKTAL